MVHVTWDEPNQKSLFSTKLSTHIIQLYTIEEERMLDEESKIPSFRPNTPQKIRRCSKGKMLAVQRQPSDNSLGIDQFLSDENKDLR